MWWPANRISGKGRKYTEYLQKKSTGNNWPLPDEHDVSASFIAFWLDRSPARIENKRLIGGRSIYCGTWWHSMGWLRAIGLYADKIFERKNLRLFYFGFLLLLKTFDCTIIGDNRRRKREKNRKRCLTSVYEIESGNEGERENVRTTWCNRIKRGMNKGERVRKLSWKLRQAPPLANSKAQRFAYLLVRRPISNWPGRAASKVVQSVNAQKNALPRGHAASCKSWYESCFKTPSARPLSTHRKIFACSFSFMYSFM